MTNTKNSLFTAGSSSSNRSSSSNYETDEKLSTPAIQSAFFFINRAFDKRIEWMEFSMTPR
jgi:hypothetical protein